jgi:hypothetical protein
MFATVVGKELKLLASKNSGTLKKNKKITVFRDIEN